MGESSSEDISTISPIIFVGGGFVLAFARWLLAEVFLNCRPALVELGVGSSSDSDTVITSILRAGVRSFVVGIAA